MKIEKPELNRYMKEKKQTIHMNNNFINNSYASSQIRSRQDVPPTQNHSGYKSLGQVQYSDNDNRGRSKTRNYIDYTKFQEQMYNKSYRGKKVFDQFSAHRTLHISSEPKSK